MLSCFSCVRLFAPHGLNPPGFSIHGILQARILKWVAMPSSRGSSPPRDQTWVSYLSCKLAGGFFTISTTWEALFTYTDSIFFFSRHFTFKTVQSEGCGAVMSHSTVWRERWAGRLLTLAQFSTSGELGLLAAVVTFKRPLKMEYSGDIKRYALYLLISEGFFHWLIFFVLFFVCVRERGNVVSYLLFFLTFSWTSKEDFIWKMWKRT